MRFGSQSFQTMFFVASFPASLSDFTVSKRFGNFRLAGQLRLPQADRDLADVDRVGQSDSVQWFVPTENHPVPILIHEPEGSVDIGSTIRGRLFQRERLLG